MSSAYDAILRDEYLKLISWFGRGHAETIINLKLGYSTDARRLAAETILPSGFEIVEKK